MLLFLGMKINIPRRMRKIIFNFLETTHLDGFCELA